MTARLPGTLAIIVLAGVTFAPARADDAQVRNELVAFYAKYSAAHQKKDVKALMSLYADDFTGVDGAGKTKDRQQKEAFWRANFASTRTTKPLTVRIEKLTVQGNKAVAHVRATASWVSTEADGEHSGSIDGFWDDTFVRTRGGWTIQRGVQQPGTKLYRDGKPVAPQPPGRESSQRNQRTA
jgi:ketosteroid isomerase-like protein